MLSKVIPVLHSLLLTFFPGAEPRIAQCPRSGGLSVTVIAFAAI